MTRQRLHVYIVAVLATAVALAARVALNPLLGEGTYPFITLFVTLVFVGWYGGLGPGVVALLLGAFGVEVLVYPPVGSLSVHPAQAGAGAALALYLINGAACIGLGHAMNRAQRALRESETRLKRILDRLPVAVGVADARGAWTLTNPLMDRLQPRIIASADPMQVDRWKAWDAAGHPVPPAEWPGQRALRGEATEPGMEMLYRHDDGRESWMLVSTAPMRADDGRVAGVIYVMADIDERKRAGEALRRSESQLELLSDTVPALISYIDADGRYRSCNRAYEMWFGLSREHVIGRTVREVTGEGAWTRIGPRLEAALAGETVEYESETPYRHGGTRWIHAVYTPHRDERGEVIGVVAMVTDVTRQKQAEEALRDADRRKDEFLAILAHELRNPLAPIRTGLELLRINEDAPGILARVRPVLERQVLHMVRLIDDLMDVSRITSGRIHLERREAPVADLVHEAVEASRAAVDGAGVGLEVEVPDRSWVVNVDPTRFMQVVSNLVHNAAKFTERGGRVTVAAVVDAGAAAPELVLAVRDTGAGIPPSLLPRVFDLFVQGGRGNQPRAGLGIGLALARQIVELHGGRIEAQSEGPGQGSTFTIRLPASRLDAEPSPDPGAVPRVRLTGRVLIVDDNEDAAETIASLVRALGGEAATAHDGESGIRQAAAFRPQLILLDIGMPGMDGYETCRRLRQEPFGARVRIVALTGWGQERDRTRALESGFDAHLTKPADPEALAALMAQAGAASSPPVVPDAG